jgi:hypothetical protein
VERGPTREEFDDELAEYTLGLMFAWDQKKAKKYAKTLLKKWTSSLRICNALALMEWRNDLPEAAVQIWSSSILWSQKFSDDLKIDTGILWNSWAWELLQRGDNSRASYVLHAIPVQSIDKDAYNSIQSTGVASHPTSTLQVKSVSHEILQKLAHNLIICSTCATARHVLWDIGDSMPLSLIPIALLYCSSPKNTISRPPLKSTHLRLRNQMTSQSRTKI